jgi:uncharacterized protein DUF6886
MREPAPPYAGEGAHALWHVSEELGIPRFRPRGDPPLVWAIDTRHMPLYWFPRECPRATFWADSETSDDDVERFLDGDRGRRVHVIEGAWLERMRSAYVVAYRMPPESFVQDDDRFWVSSETLEPIEVVDLGDLLARHAEAQIELRVAPSLYPLWDTVVASTLGHSGIRLRNAALAR